VDLYSAQLPEVTDVTEVVEQEYSSSGPSPSSLECLYASSSKKRRRRAHACLSSPAIAQTDWTVSGNPLVVRASPANGEAQLQNPPRFAWPRNGAGAYDVEIQSPSGALPLVTVNRNWYLPTKALPQGNYTWRVRPSGTTMWSPARTFSITANSAVFEVPDNQALRTRINGKARPRSLPPLSTFAFAGWSTQKRSDLEPFASRLINEVMRQTSGLAAPSETEWPLVISSPMTQAMVDQQNHVRSRIEALTRQLEAAAIVWRLNKDPSSAQTFLNEAIKRGDELAALNPNGGTSYDNQDQATRQIALSLVKAADLLDGTLDAARKARWLGSASVRANEMYNRLAHLEQNPLDSHGTTNLVYLALLSSLALGQNEAPDAQKWFDFAFRYYVGYPSPWSGQEGGYANGTKYAYESVGYYLSMWDPMLQATGVNMYAKRWSTGFMDFLTQFIPPGITVHAFGDGSETEPGRAPDGSSRGPTLLRAFATRMWSPRAAWYVDELGEGPFEDALSALQAPYPLPVSDTTFRGPPSSSAFFPSIGWVAMHNDIAIPRDSTTVQRTSFFFKSSPYGSYNHSHGDQNGILLSVGDQPLLVKAGRYDWYDSPEWNSWYRQTTSQNAITFDGGQGQKVDGSDQERMKNNGSIKYFTAPPGYDFAEGDAKNAYAGKLEMATRQVWHPRDANGIGRNIIIVRDKLAAAQPHTYEFNIHARLPITDNPYDGKRGVRIGSGAQSVCLRDLNGNTGFIRPLGSGSTLPGVSEDHYAFTLNNAGNGTTAEFLILLDVGCNNPAVSVDPPVVVNGRITSHRVTVGGQSYTFN